MFNLIPENLRSYIKKEYNFRKVILSLFFVIIIQITFLIFIFPTWIISKFKEQDIGIDMKASDDYFSSLNIASTTSDIKKINSTLTVIDSVLNYPTSIPYIDNILSKKPSSIRITDISYVLSEKKKATIDIEGISSTRESLTAFVRGLESLNLFEKVNLPISNFAKDKDLPFVINLIIQTQ